MISFNLHPEPDDYQPIFESCSSALFAAQTQHCLALCDLSATLQNYVQHLWLFGCDDTHPELNIDLLSTMETQWKLRVSELPSFPSVSQTTDIDVVWTCKPSPSITCSLNLYCLCTFMNLYFLIKQSLYACVNHIFWRVWGHFCVLVENISAALFQIVKIPPHTSQWRLSCIILWPQQWSTPGASIIKNSINRLQPRGYLLPPASEIQTQTNPTLC